MLLTPKVRTAFVGQFIERTAPTWAGGYRHGVRWNSFLPPITVRPASDGAQPRPVQSGLPPRGSRDPMSVAPGPRRRVACSRSRLLLQRAEAHPLTLFGLFAVVAMLVCYALEARSRWFVLAFAGACVLGSAYGFLQGAWPFGVVEAIWALVALRRWRRAG